MINVGTCRGEYSLPMKDTIFAACIEISSQPSFSLLITSGSEEFAVLGRIGSPEGPNPRISIPTLDVRPVSISCLCRKSATRARPLPSSNAPNRKLKQEQTFYSKYNMRTTRQYTQGSRLPTVHVSYHGTSYFRSERNTQRR